MIQIKKSEARNQSCKTLELIFDIFTKRIRPQIYPARDDNAMSCKSTFSL